MKQYILLILFVMTSFVMYSQIKDSTGDVSTVPIKNGYLDIKEISIKLEKNIYQVTMTMNDDIPVKTEFPWEFIEWDIMIDADQNKKTRTWGPFFNLTNDIGADFMVRLMLTYDSFHGEVWQDDDNKSPTNYEIKKNQIVLYFKVFKIKNPDSFDYTVMVRKYISKGSPYGLVYYDKMPEKGHFTFQK